MKQETGLVILENLLSNIDFARVVIPHLKEEYYQNKIEQELCKFITLFFNKQHKLPTKKILGLYIENHAKLKEEEVQAAHSVIDEFDDKPEPNVDWLITEAEKFCRDKAIFNAMTLAIDIKDGVNTTHSETAIPSLLQQALSVCFDKNVGHNYLNDAEKRYEYYHNKEKKVPFPIEILNKITDGGVSTKTLNLYMMPPKTGKTLVMCDHAAYCIRNGYKALYITLEMAEHKIAERIDANLFEMTIKDVKRLSKEQYLSKFKQKYDGNLVIKEYPTCGGHAGHFKALLDELKMKNGFIPDIIFIDYLNICASSRMKNNGSVNSYQYIKAIGEELRGLAVEYDVPIVSATQTNRGGANNSDLEVDDLSDSFGTAMTVDLMLAGMRTPELDEIGQMMFKQILSRYGDVNYYRKFVVGVKLSQFKLFDVVDSQQNITDKGVHDTDIKKTVHDKPADAIGKNVQLEWD